MKARNYRFSPKRTRKGYELDGVLLEPLRQKEYNTPVFCISESGIRNRARLMRDSFSYEPVLFLYANKSDRLLAVQRILLEEGIGIQAGSIGEMYLGLRAGCPPEKMRTTMNLQNEEFLLYAVQNGVKPYLDSFEDISRFKFLIKKGLVPPEFAVGVRINPGRGDGEEIGHTVTGGPESEFGIYRSHIERLKRDARKKPAVSINALEMHIGSNFKSADIYFQCFRTLMDIALDFESSGFSIDELSGGGGKGVTYRDREKDLDIKNFGKQIHEMMNEYSAKAGKKPLLVFEDGRWYVSDGILLTEIGSIKHNPDQLPMVIINAGIPHVLRIPMYDAVHPFYNISKPFGKNQHVSIRGNDCEHVTLSHDAFIGKPEVGDIIGIGKATAYCVASMENEYGGKPQCPVLLLNKGKVDVIREKGNLSDLVRNETVPSRLGGMPSDIKP